MSAMMVPRESDAKKVTTVTKKEHKCSLNEQSGDVGNDRKRTTENKLLLMQTESLKLPQCDYAETNYYYYYYNTYQTYLKEKT